MSAYDKITATLKEIPEQHDIELINELNNHKLEFTFAPSLISTSKSFLSSYNLNWETRKLTDFESHMLPEEAGLYSFSIGLSDNSFPENNYILYYGETNKQTIQERFKQYTTKSQISKRQSIFKMLKSWKEYLYFSYATVNYKPSEIKEIEKKLNDAFMPPYSIRDYSEPVRTARRYDAY